jgi:hypothetical protein
MSSGGDDVWANSKRPSIIAGSAPEGGGDGDAAIHVVARQFLRPLLSTSRRLLWTRHVYEITKVRRALGHRISRRDLRAIYSMSTVARTLRLTAAQSVRPWRCSVRRGCFREALPKQDGMRCPAGCLASNTREAPGNGPPPRAHVARADAKSAFTRVFDALWRARRAE